ncbi:hypothetical protein EYF80_059680 [Liparis tanakae]|uniref:Uncharacterized protein n=1 Tax=Liparis tanakae TaxID=230148 RepID=A0A4Z2EN37_9TELE|nr:hypothetical protein EYF80_059680 [Liparis tanakae]
MRSSFTRRGPRGVTAASSGRGRRRVQHVRGRRPAWTSPASSLISPTRAASTFESTSLSQSLPPSPASIPPPPLPPPLPPPVSAAAAAESLGFSDRYF